MIRIEYARGVLHATAVADGAFRTIFHELRAQLRLRQLGFQNIRETWDLPVLDESGLENGSIFRARIYIVSKFKNINP